MTALLDALAYFAFGMLMLRTGNLWLNVWKDPRLPRSNISSVAGRVSVLIPARNEAKNIVATLQAWIPLASQLHEIIVLDDHSEDDTANLVRQQQANFPMLRLLNGQPLPSGWLGKNYACYQLAQAATGDYLLFADADVTPHAGLIEATLAQLHQKKLDLLSIFPDQRMQTNGEKIVVPLMHYILLSLLPLFFIHRFRFPSMAAANGQFMLFRTEAYHALGGHSVVKHCVAEDIQLVRELKARGMRAATFLGNQLIECRMYRNYPEAIQGFSKNFLAGFGNAFGVLFYLYLIFGGWILIAVRIPIWLAPSVLLVVLTNWGLARLSNQSFLMLLWTHPLRIFATLQVGINSIMRKLKKQNTWKGRNVYSPMP